MKARHGANWLHYASRAAGGATNAALDAYGLLKTMIDHWRDVFDEAFGRNDKHRARNFTSTALGSAQRHVASLDPAAGRRGAPVSRRDASASEAVKAPPAEVAELKKLYDAQRQSGMLTPGGAPDSETPAAARPILALATKEELDDKPGKALRALDRGRPAAPRRARQPLQGSRVRRRSFRGRCRPCDRRLCGPGEFLPHHLPDRRPAARSDDKPSAAGRRGRRSGDWPSDGIRRRQDAHDARGLSPRQCDQSVAARRRRRRLPRRLASRRGGSRRWPSSSAPPRAPTSR